MTSTSSLQAMMLTTPEGSSRFCMHHLPAAKPRAAILHVHALAHEMHFARPTSAAAARALAHAGFAVLQIDAFGCGDSAGEFAQATVTRWQEDLQLGATWLRNQYADTPLWLWAERAAALWAQPALTTLSPSAVLLWQPLTTGRDALAAALRAEIPQAMERGETGRNVRERADAEWAAGRPVDLGGYSFSATLAHALQQASSAGAADALHGAATAQIDVSVTQDTGHRLTIHRQVGGPSPWTGQGVNDLLIEATVAAARELSLKIAMPCAPHCPTP